MILDEKINSITVL